MPSLRRSDPVTEYARVEVAHPELKELADAVADVAGQCAPLADPDAWQQLLAAAQAKKWQVYAKPPFGGAAQHLFFD